MTCQEICPLDAITEAEAEGVEMRLDVEDSRCIGCGLCAAHCPAGAIRMVKVRDDLPAPTLQEMMKRYHDEKVATEA